MDAYDSLLNRFIIRVQGGDEIFKEGDPGDFMYVIRSGKVRIYKAMGDKETTLADLGQGDFFGEMALISGRPRTASAKAAADTLLLALNASHLDSVIRADIEVAVKMIRVLVSRLMEADLKIETLSVHGPLQRVAFYLAKMGQAEESQEKPGPLTIEQIMAATNLNTEMVEFAVQRLGDLGLLQRADGKVKLILDPERLMEQARSGMDRGWP